MARTGVSIQELMEVLKETGLPMGSLTPAEQRGVQGQEIVAPKVRERFNPVIEKAKKNYMDKINQIAMADQRIAGALSDPSSNLYLENPMDRERVASGAENVQYKDAGRLAGELEQSQKFVDDVVDEAVDLFQKLTPTKGKGGGTGSSKAKKEKKEAGMELAEKAGFFDARMQEEFLNTPPDFQKYYLREHLRSPQTIELPELKRLVAEWKTTFNRTASGARSAKTTSSKKKVDVDLGKLDSITLEE